MSEKPKPRKLRARWDKRERDMKFFYPTCGADGILIHVALNTRMESGLTLTEELERRGFDLTTLRFEIALKEPK